MAIEPAHLICQRGYVRLRQDLQIGVIENMEWVKELICVRAASQIRFFLIHVLQGPALCRLWYRLSPRRSLVAKIFEGMCCYSQQFLQWEGVSLLESRYKDCCRKARERAQREMEELERQGVGDECAYVEEIILRYMREVSYAMERDQRMACTEAFLTWKK